ncbi:MAG: hypothetical protein WAL70_16220 [Aeromicrobium sp.]
MTPSASSQPPGEHVGGGGLGVGGDVVDQGGDDTDAQRGAGQRVDAGAEAGIAHGREGHEPPDGLEVRAAAGDERQLAVAEDAAEHALDRVRMTDVGDEQAVVIA